MEYHLPELGEGVYEAELTEWKVQPGDSVAHGQALGEVLTDKATMELPSPFSGTIERLMAAVGDTLKVGQPILAYQTREGEDQASSAEGGAHGPETAPIGPETAPIAESPKKAREASGAPRRGEPPAAPSVRRMARSLHVDLAAIPGSGPGGRVLIEDVARHARRSRPASQAPAAATVHKVTPELEPAGEATESFGRPGDRIKLAGVRRKIADQMSLASRTIPHYSYVDECDVTDLVRLRESLKHPLSSQGVRLTFVPFFLKAAAGALREVPLVNSSLDEEQGEIRLHEDCHLGLAVATPSGLIVPVIKSADRLTILELAQEVDRVATSARKGRIGIEDLRGATFTVTSIGNIGGLISTPIINPPQTAIMGIGRIVRRPVYRADGALVPADCVYLSFSFDHRVIDGAIGAAFGNAVKRRLENAAAMLLSPGV